MSTLFRGLLLVALLLPALFALAQGELEYFSEGTQGCLQCHDFGPDAPVHALLSGSHGISGDAEAMAGRRGCEDCHGPSAAHADAPREISPYVSFGPRWTSTSAAQDGQCLACHENNIAKNWRNALHMVNGLTCVTCHDLLVEEDKVIFEEQQAEVCTVCHKAQKQGIHGMPALAAKSPPCSACHNPHDHETAQDAMLANDSMGCRYCHDLDLVSADTGAGKAENYHKTLTQQDGTCLQCHQDVAHAPANSAPAMDPVAQTSGTLTLFYPGIADSDWMLQAHPGSQPLRQGTNCRRCHRGDEAAMGESRSGDLKPAHRDVQVAFSREKDDLLIELLWSGDESDVAISLMWGTQENLAFRRGGCFAACHSDMPGMSDDRGHQVSKYLMSSRVQQQELGQPAVRKSDEDLAALLSQGQFAELWRIQLDADEVETAIVLADTKTRLTKLIEVNKSYANGHWRVALRRKMDNTKAGLSFFPKNKYTFGIALNGAQNAAGGHWVSLPRTLSFAGDDTDYIAE